MSKQHDAPATTTTLLDSYRVEVAETFEASFSEFRPAYLLHGKRGAMYALFRTQKNPKVLFSVNARNYSNAQLKGNSWFAEEDGELVVIG